MYKNYNMIKGKNFCKDMSLFKKKLTEQEAVSNFILYTMKGAQDAWPIFYNTLKKRYKDKFVVEDETMATFDLALAVTAQELQAVKNLFPDDQAKRIEKWVLEFINTKDWGEYAVNEVKKYGEDFQKDIQNISEGADPTSSIPGRLLHRWLGKNIKNFDVEINGKETGVVDPLLLMSVSNLLVPFLGYWKKIKNQFNLVKGDIPTDMNPAGLKDFSPEPADDKPDGTIRYYDDKGYLKEKWLPPQTIKELLKKGGTKRLYKVLVKGPWDGVKETYWELSDKTVADFVDEKDYAYAVCTYKKGEPEYVLIKKKLWNNMDEMEKITMDPNLSDAQKAEAIKELST